MYYEYDNDCAFSRHDAELEMKAQAAEDRFEYEAEEAHARLWAGESEIDRATRRAPMSAQPMPIINEVQPRKKSA